MGITFIFISIAILLMTFAALLFMIFLIGISNLLNISINNTVYFIIFASAATSLFFFKQKP